MPLHGVDISGWDEGINVKSLTADFVIVKATEGVQGTIYNPAYRSMADAALNSGKLIGFYHYANGGDPVAEADSFYEAIQGYKGKAVVALDWERQGNRQFEKGNDVTWCSQFMTRLQSKMGAKPLLYTSKTLCNEYDWSLVSNKFPLWGAEYAYDDYIYQGYETDPWQSKLPWGSWGPSAQLFQYGYVNPKPNNGGISTGLDGDILYGTKETWQIWCGSSSTPESITTINKVKVNVADIAAAIHYDMCVDPANGYSQAPVRWGGDSPHGIKSLKLYGREYSYKRGSYDCSSSVITAWREALKGTPYEGKLDSATYTGDMYRVFIKSGLFYGDMKPAKRGDIYLAEEKHTAMCQDGGSDGVLGYDALSEFNRNENHGATYGKVGDQDGYESVIRNYYDDGWNWVMHYNGKADFYADSKDTVYLEESTGDQEEDEMICIIHPDEANYMIYMNGNRIFKLRSLKQQEAIKKIYSKTHNGKNIPMFALGTKKDPVFKFVEELFDITESEENEKIRSIVNEEIKKIKLPTIDNDEIAMKVVEKLALNDIFEQKA